MGAWVRACVCGPLGECGPYSLSNRHQRDAAAHMQMAGWKDTKAELHRERQSVVLQCWLTDSYSRVSQVEREASRWKTRCEHDATQTLCCVQVNNSLDSCQRECCVRNTTNVNIRALYTHLEWRWSGLIAGNPGWQGEKKEEDGRELIIIRTVDEANVRELLSFYPPIHSPSSILCFKSYLIHLRAGLMSALC